MPPMTKDIVARIATVAYRMKKLKSVRARSGTPPGAVPGMKTRSKMFISGDAAVVEPNPYPYRQTSTNAGRAK